MNHFKFLQQFQELQKEISYDEVLYLKNIPISYSKTDPSPFQNFALVNEHISKQQLYDIEVKFKDLHRKSTIYFLHNKSLHSLEELLLNNNYRKNWEDAWMFYNGKNVNTLNFSNIKKVETSEDLKIFLDTFNRCYQKNDPQNPYGELGEFLIGSEQQWQPFHESNRLEYFIAYKNDKPVATSILNNFNGIGYISGVGSLREVRGEGYGKKATLYAVYVSQQRANKLHCLATEEGTYPNEFYKRIGFETKFNALGYVK